MTKYEGLQKNDLWELLREGARGLGVVLSGEAVGHFSLYLAELKAWNKKINLFSRENDREIVVKDFLDSLTVAKHLFPGASVLDIGSGGGFPGIPIKISRRDLRVVLSEVRTKKFFFLKHVIRVLGIENLEVVAPGEKISEKFDFVVSRAFGSIVKSVETGADYLKKNGVILSMKGRKGKEELKGELPVLNKTGWALDFIEPVELPVFGHKRVIIGFRRNVSRETNY